MNIGRRAEDRRLDDRSSAEVETVSTILVEVRDTAGMAPKEEVEEMLRSRLDRADVRLSEGEIADLVSQVTEGDD